MDGRNYKGVVESVGVFNYKDLSNQNSEWLSFVNGAKRMKRSCLCCIMVLLLLFSCYSFALAGNITSTVMIGTGSSKAEAVQDAIEKAIESATAIFVYSSSEVKNFRKVRNKIFTAARKYVKEFKVLECYNYGGFYFAKLNIAVDSQKIASAFSRGAKALTYSDAMRDYAHINSPVERNKKYLEILKSISARPVSDFYYFDFVRYDVLKKESESVDVVLTYRISLNNFLWGEYYDVIRGIEHACRTEGENHVIINYKPTGSHPGHTKIAGDRLCIHDDFNDYVIVPRGVRLKAQLPNDIYESGYLFRLYDRHINYRKGDPWIYMEETVQNGIIHNATGYFIGDDGFELKIPVSLSDVKDVKELPQIKVYLTEAETGIDKFVWK